MHTSLEVSLYSLVLLSKPALIFFLLASEPELDVRCDTWSVFRPTTTNERFQTLTACCVGCVLSKLVNDISILVLFLEKMS